MKQPNSRKPTPPPTAKFTFIARFGCGFLLGLILAIWWGISRVPGDLVLSVFIGLIVAVICGLLTWRFGDRFIYWLIRWF